jgi:hypothetical protein
MGSIRTRLEVENFFPPSFDRVSSQFGSRFNGTRRFPGLTPVDEPPIESRSSRAPMTKRVTRLTRREKGLLPRGKNLWTTRAARVTRRIIVQPDARIERRGIGLTRSRAKIDRVRR